MKICKYDLQNIANNDRISMMLPAITKPGDTVVLKKDPDIDYNNESGAYEVIDVYTGESAILVNGVLDD